MVVFRRGHFSGHSHSHRILSKNEKIQLFRFLDDPSTSCVPTGSSHSASTASIKTTTSTMPLSEDQEHEMMDIFAKYGSGGKIGSSEIAKACRAGGLNPSEADLKEWKSEVKSGLDEAGFVKFMNRKFGESGDSTDEIVDAFQAFDTTGNGTISTTELKHILTTMGEKMTETEVNTLISECDVDNGKINYMTMANMLYSG